MLDKQVLETYSHISLLNALYLSGRFSSTWKTNGFGLVTESVLRFKFVEDDDIFLTIVLNDLTESEKNRKSKILIFL